MGFAIIGSALATPDQVVTNDDLTQFMTTSDEWIRQRTGIERRHVVQTETTESLATDVAHQLLRKSGITADELDLIAGSDDVTDVHHAECGSNGSGCHWCPQRNESRYWFGVHRLRGGVIGRPWTGDGPP